MLFSPVDPWHPIGLAAALTATGIRLPLPGGGEVEFNSSGTWNYRHPNWQGSQLLLSWTTATTPTYGSAFTPFGEKYAVDSSGFNGYFAGMLGIADEGGISDAYQADARLMQPARGRWVSPDPAGLGAVDMTNPQSWNRYAYVLNNPLNIVDPSGLDGNGCWAFYGGSGGSYAVIVICPNSYVPIPVISFNIPAASYTGGGVSGGSSQAPSKAVRVARCAASLANQVSAASLLPANAPKFFQNLLSNDISSVSDLLTGPGAGQAQDSTLQLRLRRPH